MRLTRYTDYSLRVLIYLSARSEGLCSIAEIAEAYGISHNHLTKVVHELGKAGYVTTVRGRAGGIRLGRPADEIRIGEIVRATEDGFDLADCRNCVIAPACGMTGVLNEAVAAFLSVLDRYTFADLPKREIDILSLFPLADAPATVERVATQRAGASR
ncbi:Rrf2 family transcriptional regulator [Aurantimonas sp. 22II-16-19i]|uniref:Rrf2 family transcriptional regulator n=1 Tax=Aurantimonas sp. 22II-16-19i TaxID=1317114 RepID=UPI0009F7AA20|nr:Rrf2 family transcriptional regulator [Aurantimonas sp. 22II-16-19i]ORE90731.1 BadM/Rrf2 family transcriptional regulator [Aurantimonas sp. 22II-16-19i]